MKISLLVPFRANSSRDYRNKPWKWLQKRWEYVLPEAEICVGTDDGGQPFSKSVAVNDAYSKSSGDMLVIADADSWVERPVLMTAIEHAAAREHLVVPWWTSYRLTRRHSEQLMSLPPDAPMPVTQEMRDAAAGTGPAPDSAAMVLCIQRTAFERVGGFDPRFRGWGSEDVSFGLACWTLLGRNRYCIGEAFALYHPRPFAKTGRPDPGEEDMRVWKNDPGGMNFDLWYRYRNAQGFPEAMLQLCREHPLPDSSTPISLAPTWSVDDMVRMGESVGDRFVAVQPERNDPHVLPLVREPLY